MKHPLHSFEYCPRCGASGFAEHDFKSKRCASCGFTYYYNAAAAVVALIINDREEILICRRVNEPAKDTLDLPGGFVDAGETLEEAILREVEEETGLCLTTAQYLFSLPNEYIYSDFTVSSCDAFFLCKHKFAATTENGLPGGKGTYDTPLRSGDDAADCRFVPLKDININAFGLTSIRNGLHRFLQGCPH